MAKDKRFKTHKLEIFDPRAEQVITLYRGTYKTFSAGADDEETAYNNLVNALEKKHDRFPELEKPT